MLNIILPIVVDYEMKDQEQRYNMRNNTMFHKISRRFFSNRTPNTVVNEESTISTEQNMIRCDSEKVLDSLSKTK